MKNYLRKVGAGLGSSIFGLILTFLVPGNQRLLATILLIVGIIAAAFVTLLFFVMNNRLRLIARRQMMDGCDCVEG